MAIVLSDELDFPFNDGRGVRTNQLNGNLVERLQLVGEQLRVTMSDGGPNAGDFVVDVSPQRNSTVRRVAVKASKQFVAADFNGASLEERITVPQFTGADKHLAIWWPAVSPAIDTVRLYTADGYLTGSPFNYISQFDDPVALAVGGSAGYYIVTTETIQESRSLDGLVAYSNQGLHTFTRYLTYRLEADGKDFVAADFTGTKALTSLTVQLGPFDADDQPSGKWFGAIAVPAAQVDVSDIFWAGGRQFGGTIVGGASWERQPGTVSISGTDYKVWRHIAAQSQLFFDERIATVYQNPKL